MTQEDQRKEPARRMREEAAEARERAIASTRSIFMVSGILMGCIGLALFGLAAALRDTKSPAMPIAIGILLLALATGFIWYSSTLAGRRYLLASGIEARGRVLEMLGMSSTALHVRGAGMMTGVLRKSKWLIEVTVAGSEPYEVTIEDFVPNTFSHQPGQELTIYVDPKRRHRVYVDWPSG